LPNTHTIIKIPTHYQTPTQLSKHPHITKHPHNCQNTHTLPNTHTIVKIPTHYQTPTQLSRYPHITKHPHNCQNTHTLTKHPHDSKIKRRDLFTDSCIYGLFNEHVHSSGNSAWNGRIISEFEGFWTEAIVVQFEALTRNMIGGSQTDHENSLRNEIWNQNFPNTNEWHRWNAKCTKKLDIKISLRARRLLIYLPWSVFTTQLIVVITSAHLPRYFQLHLYTKYTSTKQTLPV